jgi:hypothetical protein
MPGIEISNAVAIVRGILRHCIWDVSHERFLSSLFWHCCDYATAFRAVL